MAPCCCPIIPDLAQIFPIAGQKILVLPKFLKLVELIAPLNPVCTVMPTILSFLL